MTNRKREAKVFTKLSKEDCSVFLCEAGIVEEESPGGVVHPAVGHRDGHCQPSHNKEER